MLIIPPTPPIPPGRWQKWYSSEQTSIITEPVLLPHRVTGAWWLGTRCYSTLWYCNIAIHSYESHGLFSLHLPIYMWNDGCPKLWNFFCKALYTSKHRSATARKDFNFLRRTSADLWRIPPRNPPPRHRHAHRRISLPGDLKNVAHGFPIILPGLYPEWQTTSVGSQTDLLKKVMGLPCAHHHGPWFTNDMTMTFQASNSSMTFSSTRGTSPSSSGLIPGWLGHLFQWSFWLENHVQRAEKHGKAPLLCLSTRRYTGIPSFNFLRIHQDNREKRWLRNKLINVTTTAKDIKRPDEEPLPMKVDKKQWRTRTKNQPTLAIGCHQGHCHQQQIGILPVGQMQSFHAGGEHLPAKRGNL